MNIEITKKNRTIKAYCYQVNDSMYWHISHYTSMGKLLYEEEDCTSYHVIRLIKDAINVSIED